MKNNHYHKILEPVKEFSSAIGIGLAVVAGGGILIFAATSMGVGMQGFFAPKVEQIRRNTYTQSESHVRGTIKELRYLSLQYGQEKTVAGQRAILSLARAQFSEIPQDLLPSDLLDFQDKALAGN
jgi:hypothetical protein